MTELTEHEKLEKRRARRQQRILASASSRLNKITGTQSGIRESLTPSPSPSPSPSTSSTLLDAKPTISVAEHFPADTDPRRRKYVNQDIISKHRPVVQQMIREEEKRSAQESSSLLGGKIPSMIMASMLFSKPTSEPAPSHPSNKYWNLLHFVAMVWLGLCAVYSEWSNVGFMRLANAWQSFDQSKYSSSSLPDRHFPVFRYFVTLQIAMHLGRIMYQEEDQRPGTESSFSSIVAQLPEYMKEPVCLLQKYGLLVNGIFRDICIVMFVIGFSCILAAIFYNE